MVNLVNLNPRWIDYEDRRGLGVAFDCMVGSHHGRKCEIRNWILFANPLDGKDPWPGESRTLILAKLQDEDDRHVVSGCGTARWHRTGDTFEFLTMQPSVNAHSCGHLTLTNGVFS